jgi:flavorubredoxin
MAMTEMDITVEPYQVAKETFVVPQFALAPPVGAFYMNSMIIRGAEPVIVDTGTIANRQTWLEHAWNIVDPLDVRWVFLSHDDPDHAGNLRQVLDACPNATLVTSWFQIGRMSVDHVDGWMPPFDRMRWLAPGESFDAGDRTLTAIVPPFFDNPTTRGLFDSSTAAYWSVDSFATVVSSPCEDVADIEPGAWRDGVLLTNRLNHPWFQWLDEEKFRAHVEESRGLKPSVIASCHSPAIHGSKISEAFDLILEIPRLPMWSEPSQVDLEAMIHMLAGTEPAHAG